MRMMVDEDDGLCVCMCALLKILSVSYTYTNGTTLPVYQLEQGGTLAPLKF